MSFLPTKLDAGEEFASVDDIFNSTDLPEATIKIPRWKKNGKPLAIRVRALSLVQREAIAKESTRKDGSIDVVAQIEATLREGCVMPRFDILQAGRLRHKNGAVLEQIANFIWSMSAIDQDLIDATVQALSAAERAPEATAADPGTGQPA